MDGTRRQQPAGHVAGEDVAEVAGGHGEVHTGAAVVAQLEVGVHVVDHLGEHPRPVDRVDRAQPVLVAEGEVVEQFLDDGLGVVEGAAHGDVEHVRVKHGGHLQGLDGTGAAVRMEDEDVDALLAAHPGNGGAAGIAGGGAEDVHEAAGAGEHVLEQVAEQLQGHVLEGERRPVEQFEDVQVAHRPHRRHLRVAEGGAAALDQLLEVGARDVVDEQRQDLQGQVLVGQPLPAVQPGLIHGRQPLGQEQAAVAGQAHHDRILETERLDAAASADVAHGKTSFSLLGRPPGRAGYSTMR